MNGVEQVIEACLLRERVTELAAERDELLERVTRTSRAMSDAMTAMARDAVTIPRLQAERDDLAAKLAASERQRQALVEAINAHAEACRIASVRWSAGDFSGDFGRNMDRTWAAVAALAAAATPEVPSGD